MYKFNNVLQCNFFQTKKNNNNNNNNIYITLRINTCKKNKKNKNIYD